LALQVASQPVRPSVLPSSTTQDMQIEKYGQRQYLQEPEELSVDIF